jgi:Putative phage holin Dp-1
MSLNNKVYDVLKAIAQVILPAMGTLYFALAGIWNLPDVEKVIGSITAIDAFFGVILSLLSHSYKPSPDGHLVVDKSGLDKDVYSLQINTPLSEIDQKKVLNLAVVLSEDSPKTD